MKRAATPVTHSQAALVVDNLSKCYGEGATEHAVLSGLSLRVDPGEFVCIVGPSGAGKTPSFAACPA